MQIEFVTNASFLVTLSNGKKLLSDPWYSDGIYYGSWFNFPPVQNRQRYLDSNPDYIYVSHLHPDHFDPETLRKFSKTAQIWLGQLPHKHLFQKIRDLGFEDIRTFPLGQSVDHEGLSITIFGDFSGSSFGAKNDVSYALDTSLMVREPGGLSIFNINDNTIQANHAEEIFKKYGAPTVSIIPCSGASLFPHAFPQYSHEQKIELTRSLTKRMSERFFKVAQILQSPKVIPAAGSYVMGGSIADYTTYLHQPTPGFLREQAAHFDFDLKRLVAMCEGDVLDVRDGDIRRNGKAVFRDFTIEQRTQYAKTLADRPLAHEKFEIPYEFSLPWSLLLQKARENLWKAQTRFSAFPAWDVEIHLEGSGERPFLFSLDSEKYEARSGRSTISFELDRRLLLMILNRAAHWNNVEIGALVRIRRMPDTFDATVHSLMSFFHL